MTIRPIIVVLLLAVPAIAQPAAEQSSPASPATFLFDNDMTVTAAASTIAAAADVVCRAEERVTPTRVFGEPGAWRQAGDVAYRAAKLVALDWPLGYVTRVVGHEIAGHGGRLREFGFRGIGYTIGVPAPYGRGGGATWFDTDNGPLISDHEVLAIHIAGMEASDVAEALADHHAFAASALSYHEAIRYLGWHLDQLRYILSSRDTPRVPGDDVGEFIVGLNEAYPDVAALTARSLKRRALVSLADPFLAYSVYAIAVGYVWHGATSTPVPAIRLRGDVRYLPLVRFQLAPYGTEWVSDHLFARGDRAFSAAFRFGDGRGQTPVGVGVQVNRLARAGPLTAGAIVHLWRQPALALGNETVTGRSASGGALAVTGEVRARRWPAAAVAFEAGYKARGFVPGEPLRRGAVVRIGVSWYGRPSPSRP